MCLLDHLGLLWRAVERETVEGGKNDSKEETGRIESTFDESLPIMLSLFILSEEKSPPPLIFLLAKVNHMTKYD